MKKKNNPKSIASIDKKYCWHPFTQMAEWTADDFEPTVIKKAKGVYLFDESGKCYLDGNSSIWTNVHGHCHPLIVKAICKQSRLLDHVSYLGLAHKNGAKLAKKLVKLTAKSLREVYRNVSTKSRLSRVFYSDNGSTAIECAMKMAWQYWQIKGEQRNEFIAFKGSYHGDTCGAAALGGIPTFFERFRALGAKTHFLKDPSELAKFSLAESKRVVAVAIEPEIQGANKMHFWRKGHLRSLVEFRRRSGAFLIFDEVFTAFGRVGKMLACEHEGVAPDFLALGKGLSGGTLPLAATLTTGEIYNAFLGKIEQMRTFYYGHSFCANPIACAAALANLRVFKKEKTLRRAGEHTKNLSEAKEILLSNPYLENVRQRACVLACDVKLPSNTKVEDFAASYRAGREVCLLAKKYGLLTRPISNTITLLLPIIARRKHIFKAVEAIDKATKDFGEGRKI